MPLCVPLHQSFPIHVLIFDCRHTHIDIDGRNALYTSYLFGRKEAGGKVAQVNTMSQFDQAISKAFRADKFEVIRKAGVFNCKEFWKLWLGYSRFGTARTSSNEAQAQGGRQEEPMCFRFFKGRLPDTTGKVLMQYKYREDDMSWMPYDYEGIPCFSDSAPSTQAMLLAHPGVRVPKPWPEKAAIAAHLQASRKLGEPEKQEWRRFFARVPVDIEDFTEDQLFVWKLPGLVKAFNEAKYVPPQAVPALGDGLGDSPRPEQPDERVQWSQFTATDARREAKIRAANYQSQQLAYQNKRKAESKKGTGVKRGRKSAPEESDGGSVDDEEVGLAAGDMGVVYLGDVVLLSPDQASRDIDLKSGYKLGLNIGQVHDMDLNESTVQLWWYFSSSLSWTTKATFVPWRDAKSHEAYMDWIDVTTLLQDRSGSLIKLELTKLSGREGYAKHNLTKKSLLLIQEVQGAPDSNDSDDD